MKSSTLTMATIVTLALACSAAEPSEGVSFDVSASTTTLGFNDTLEVKVEVTIVGDEDSFSVSEMPELEIEGFTVTSSKSSSMRSVVDDLPSVTRSTTYKLRPTGHGTFVIPSITLDYSDTRTGAVSSLNSADITVTVSPPKSGSDRTVGLIILALVVVVIITTSVIIYIRVQRKRRSVPVAPDSDRPEAVLRGILKKVEVTVAHGKSAEAQRLLCNALREYIESRYSFSPQTAAKRDVYEALVECKVPKRLQDIYMKLMEWEAELKYGGLPRSEKEIGAETSELRSFLEQ